MHGADEEEEEEEGKNEVVDEDVGDSAVGVEDRRDPEAEKEEEEEFPVEAELGTGRSKRR